MKCIYCLTEKTPAEFTADHIIPKAFGAFRDNLTLQECVCHECNQYFGHSVEEHLARDSQEGILRYMTELVDPAKFDPKRKRMLKTRIRAKGPRKGMVVNFVYDPEKKKLGLDPPNQIGFEGSSDSEWLYFEPTEITSKKDMIAKGCKFPCKIILFPSSASEELRSILRSRDFDLEHQESDVELPHPGEDVWVETEETIDREILRAVAKIGFNYFTFHCGKQFTLNTTFDGFRRYVRYGEYHDTKYVLCEGSRLLFEERQLGQRIFQGHLITLEWNQKLRSIISQVTLFNVMKYIIVFSRGYRGVTPNVTGSQFDPATGEINALVSPSPLISLPFRKL